ncbi:MAG TPA: T9SS type A sorting domain-containing protein [Chitinophagales bacterium]|nr:T9SS type A sorting domain-containing protein [Chitinophagales bacterium]
MKTLLTLSVFVFLSYDTRAQLIFQHIKAEVISLDDDDNKLNNQIQLGDTLMGTLSYSHNVTDSNSDPTVGDYLYSTTPYGISLIGPGNLLFQSDGNNVDFLCEAVDLPVVDGGDAITFRSYNNYYSLGNAATDKLISWTVNNDDGTNLSSDALPIILDLSIWDQLYGLTIGADDFPDGTLGYFIRATVVEIETDEGTGVNNLVSGNEERIFPNPVHSSFTISNPVADGTLVIEDVNGKVMMSKTAVTSEVDISDFLPGLYVVKIIGKKEVKVIRMVKS